MRHHGGLGGLMARCFCKHLAFGEVHSFMWETLPTLIATWGPDVTPKASTHWYYLTMALVRKEQKQNIYAAGIKVTEGTVKKFKKVPLSVVDAPFAESPWQQQQLLALAKERNRG